MLSIQDLTQHFTVADEAEGIDRARLERPREALPDGRLREGIAWNVRKCN